MESFRSSTVKHDIRELGYKVDLADLLFTPERNFLVLNNGHKVTIDDLKGKTIVLFIFPLEEVILERGDYLDIFYAYKELLPLGSFEFVFVPVKPLCSDPPFESGEGIFTYLFSFLPFPAVPFSYVEACADRVVYTFSVDDPCIDHYSLPFWVVIDQTNTVVATRFHYPVLFKLFGGAELYPLSQERFSNLMDHYYSESREQRVSKWDQLLASPTRNFLLSSNGDEVPISSLKDKVIGLYFCDNISHPPSMELIKKVYQEAKRRGYDFEIVQITFHYHHFYAIHNFYPDGFDPYGLDPYEERCSEDISWLKLPFRDPSCRKIQRIFDCDDSRDYASCWDGDCLVIVNPRKADSNSEVLFEFSGSEILMRYGIEGYPFTRASLIEMECKIQEIEVRLEQVFPPEERSLIRSVSNNVDGSTLFGKRVLVLFADQSHLKSGFEFVSMLESKYRAQNVAAESKFEVVYVQTDSCESGSYIIPCFEQMPWYVFPYVSGFKRYCLPKVYKACASGLSVAAFDKDGKLIAKECGLDRTWWKKEGHKLEFPFISQDLKGFIGREVVRMCKLDKYYHWNGK